MNDLIGKITQGDCLELMRVLPDKCIDLVLTDPPYGIGIAKTGSIGNPDGPCRAWKTRVKRTFEKSDWDNKIPDKEVFEEMFRVSKNQVIWGGNYFVEFLYNSPCWLFWDKKNGSSTFADGELAWTSFKTATRQFEHLWDGFKQEAGIRDDRVHPTQKPLKLFSWILHNYSKENDLILDPFSGSGTTAIACHKLKRRFICFEKEPKYVELSRERLEQVRAQQTLF